MTYSDIGAPPTTGNPVKVAIWYTPDCGFLHLTWDQMIHIVCPDGVH